MIKQKICIIGNGLTGLTAALILGKLNLDVHLIAAPDKKRRRDIRTTAISESNYKGLIGFIEKKNYNRKKIDLILNQQLPQHIKCQRSDYCINNLSIVNLKSEILKVHKKLQR